MDELIFCDMNLFFGVLRLAKEYFDEGAISIPGLISSYGAYMEDLCCECQYEVMYNVAEYVNCKRIYVTDADGHYDEESEVDYEEWFFSSTDMTEYYRYLYELLKSKIITSDEYSKFCDNMFSDVRRYMRYTRASGSLRTKINHKYASSLKLYIDDDFYNYDPIAVSFSVAAIFDMYTRELKKLKEMYGKRKLLEAA